MIEDLAWSALLFLGIFLLARALGGGPSRADLRSRRRWEEVLDHEIHRSSRTDATGMVLCRSCGASASESAGRCPSCGAGL